jgi:misacylated tRNA(Ala) deacylase
VINFNRRWDFMQQHTGQHLLSAIMETFDDLDTIGWGMGGEGAMNYVDLRRQPTSEELETIQKRCNRVIQDNLPITVELTDNDHSESLPVDYDKQNGIVRVIDI